MNHKELLEQDLSGWKVAKAYHLELKHKLMGFFPAVFSDKVEEMFICLDKKLLAEVAKFLPPRSCRCSEFIVLVNEGMGIAFDIKIIAENRSCKNPDEDTSLYVLDRYKLNRLVSQAKEGESPFKWAPGLISDDMSPEEFKESLKLVLA